MSSYNTPGNREPVVGYRRSHGELALLGVAIAAATVREILKTAGVDPAPRRTTVAWADYLRSPAEAILVMDFVETVTPTGQRLYVRAVIHRAGRRVRILAPPRAPPMLGSPRPSAPRSCRPAFDVATGAIVMPDAGLSRQPCPATTERLPLAEVHDCATDLADVGPDLGSFE